jgi:hypothetical protein
MHAFVSGATFEWVRKSVCWQELSVNTLFCSLPEVLNFRTGIPSCSGRIKEMFFIPSRTKKPGVDTKLDDVSRFKVSFAMRWYCRLPFPGVKDDVRNDLELFWPFFSFMLPEGRFVIFSFSGRSLGLEVLLFGMIVDSTSNSCFVVMMLRVSFSLAD